MDGGTVALLFSDIEGSTRLLQQLGPAYADVLVDHHRLLREAFAANGGNERGCEGDSFFVTFPAAADAVAAALVAQLALAGHAWPGGVRVRVRMGVHVGLIQSVADTVVGMAVHEAARICSAAHGGQVLASDQLVAATEPPLEATWTSLGEHRLKDLPAPMRLHQLSHPALGTQFPPPRSEGASRSNLPAQPTAFIGRTAEIAHVAELLRRGRLLTVTGAGGVGKSRIALRVAADAAADFRDGVWFVDLAAVNDPEAVVTAVATSLGAPVSTTADLLSWVDDQHVLVVVDNCEHLIAATSDVVASLLRRCANVTVLTTSREPLGLSPEVVWRVPPLTPADATSLLTLRAQAANERFAVTDANRSAVEAVCRRLDAIPLALELAAARLTTLSVEQLEQRLDQRFRLLSGGVRGGLERHRTLQATVDWSYDLLSPDEQSVLARLGVFVGSFPLQGLEVVVPDVDPIDLVLIVDQLVRKSLLIVDQQEQEPRYRLLETVRQYALDRLMRTGDVGAARDAHLAWITDLMNAAARTLWLGGDETEWLTRLDAEESNIRSALDWALESGAVDDAAVTVFGASCWWLSRGQTLEGLRLTQQTLQAQPTGVAEALLVLTEMSMASGSGRLVPEMVERVRGTADRVKGTPYEWVRPIAFAHVAAWSYTTGDVDGAANAIPLCRKFAAEAAAYGPGARGWALQTLVWTNLDAGRLEDARAAADAAVAVAAEARLSILESRMSVNRARMAMSQADYDTAWSYAERAVRVARGTGETFVIAVATQLMADVALARGDVALARDLLASIVDAVADSMTQADVDAVVGRLAELSGQNS